MFTNLASLKAVHNHFSNRVREIVGEGAAAFRADVKQEQARGTGLHRRTGKLFNSTTTQTRWTGRTVTITAQNPLKYAPYLEFGTRPHVIRPKHPGGTLRFFWTKVGRWVALKKVNHPGNRTYHFLFRAVKVCGERMFYSLHYALDELGRRF